MKNNCKILSIICLILFLGGCSNKNEIDSLIINEWEKCGDKNSCIIDFSTVMSFEWDKMFYFSSALSLEEINAKLGTELQGFIDIGDRLIFMSNDKIVYHQEWFYDPSGKPQGTIFSIDDNFLEISKNQSKFKITKNEDVYYLEPLR